MQKYNVHSHQHQISDQPLSSEAVFCPLTRSLLFDHVKHWQSNARQDQTAVWQLRPRIYISPLCILWYLKQVLGRWIIIIVVLIVINIAIMIMIIINNNNNSHNYYVMWWHHYYSLKWEITSSNRGGGSINSLDWKYWRKHRTYTTL